jgi:AcrR family transcriptional regulator
VGVSPSAAYHHYKAALLGAVATDGLAAMAQSFEQAILDAHASAGSRRKRSGIGRVRSAGASLCALCAQECTSLSGDVRPVRRPPKIKSRRTPKPGESPYLLLGAVLDELRDAGCPCNRASRCASHSLGHPFMRLACLLVAGAMKGASADNFKDVVREVSRRTLAGLNA